MTLKSRLLLISALLTCSLLLACGGGGSSESGSRPDPVTALAATQNELVAQYSVTTQFAAQIRVEFGTDTNYVQSTAWYPLPQDGGTVKILVAGMKQATTYHMRAEVDGNGTTWQDQDQTFTTGSITTVVPPQITVTRPSNAADVNPGIEMLDMVIYAPNNKATTVATDLDGNPIWYYDPGSAAGNSPYTVKLLSNGHILISIFSSLVGSFALREIDLAGNTVRELNYKDLNQRLKDRGFDLVQSGFHHDFIPMDNGHLIVLVSTYKEFTDLPGYPGTINVIGDAIVDLDSDFNPVWTWNAFDHLDINRHLMGLPDWTHSNALVYTENDGNLLLSMRHQSWVIKINYQNGTGNGDILWKLGHEGDFQLAGGDPSKWFYAQHFPSLISTNGSQLMFTIFDNGNLRVDDQGMSCGTPGAPDCYSRSAVFQIDEQAKTADLMWEFLPGQFSFWGGNSNQLANGNIEFDMSEPFQQTKPFASRIMEVTQTVSPETVWQMDIDGINAYRAYRIQSLYPGVQW